MKPLTMNEAKEWLRYEPETGHLYWVKSPNNRVPEGAKAGFLDGHGYIAIRILWHQTKAHRVAWLLTHGMWPKNELDHINGNRSDNRLDNLREATKTQNMWNRGATAKNSSGFKGVSFHKPTGKWQAKISVNKKQMSIGLFETAELASAAYMDSSRRYFGEFSRHP